METDFKNPADKSLQGLEQNDYVSLPRIWPSYFSKDACAEIIKMSYELPETEGFFGTGANSFLEYEIRKSRIKWIFPNNETKWIFEKLREVILQGNQLYKFRLHGIPSIQIAEYTDGGHYDWHIDTGKGYTSNRKLSISVQLSDSSEYEGGDLEFLEKKECYQTERRKLDR
jgi:PKHD-type hydroxylase